MVTATSWQAATKPKTKWRNKRRTGWIGVRWGKGTFVHKSSLPSTPPSFKKRHFLRQRSRHTLAEKCFETALYSVPAALASHPCGRHLMRRVYIRSHHAGGADCQTAATKSGAASFPTHAGGISCGGFIPLSPCGRHPGRRGMDFVLRQGSGPFWDGDSTLLVQPRTKTAR